MMCDNNNTNNNTDNLIGQREVAQMELPRSAAAQHSIAAMNPCTAKSDDSTLPLVMNGDNGLLGYNNTKSVELVRSPAAAETPGACLADKLSSSLLSIATAGHERSENVLKRGRTGGMENLSEDCESSSSQSGRPTGNGSGGGANVVTGTATTASSGDNNNNNNLSSGDDRFYAENEHTLKQQPRSSSSLLLETGSLEVVQRHHHFHHHHHHHHHYRQRKRPQQAKSSSASASADDYGLPVPPTDDRFHAESPTNNKHATVVAHLPPPNTDSASGSGLEGGEVDERKESSGSLLQPHREPGFNTIRLSFKKLVRRDTSKSSETDSSNDQPVAHKKKKGTKYSHSSLKQPVTSVSMKDAPKRKRNMHEPGGDSSSSEDDNAGTNGSSSSGSGTEGGYAASASSNEHVARAASSSDSSPSVSSSEDVGMAKRKRSKTTSTLTAGGCETRPLLSKKQESNLSISSEIADFSSGASESEVAETIMKTLREDLSAESSPSITSDDGSSDEQEETRRRPPVQKRAERALLQASAEARMRHAARSHPPLSLQVPTSATVYTSNDATPRGRLKTDDESGPILQGKPPILAVGCDIMAHVLTFLEPPDILNVLTMPLSKDWLDTFTRQPELWRVLCLVEPFKAPVDEESSDDDDSGDDSFASFPMKSTSNDHHGFGKFRMMYTSFVRCMRYLERIKDDAQNGRPPSIIDFGATNDTSKSCNIGANHNLQNFLARARGVVIRSNEVRPGAEVAGGSLTDSSSDDDNSNEVAAVARLAPAHPIGVSDDDSSTHFPEKKRRRGKDNMIGGKKKLKYGRSMITDRLLLPAQGGVAGNPELPWSCAVYSIVNWMVAFADVEGIQTMCLKVLPFLLEDEQQRITAQRAGLTDVVLRGMIMFPDSAALHTASFHTIVLLARPLGGREGMLFHTSMVNSSGIFSSGAGGSQSGRNGIAVMLDSMRRFQQNELLQAMSCWSLVNIALVPAQKEVLVKLGGIAATANAMMAHAYNAEVQFRALFALINLVIPSVSLNPEDDAAPQLAPDDSTERELLDESVEQIASLVVQAMKNFCSSEAILNRACLVLHNLSLTPEYHSVLLWTPNAYQMLEWCLTNYRTDQVLQQSAAGTLHRLQIYLSSDESLRARFAASIQAQQQQSLELAHREAVILHQQHEQRLREEEQRQQASAAAQQQP